MPSYELYKQMRLSVRQLAITIRVAGIFKLGNFPWELTGIYGNWKITNIWELMEINLKKTL